jgi:hypothetical protein
MQQIHLLYLVFTLEWRLDSLLYKALRKIRSDHPGTMLHQSDKEAGWLAVSLIMQSTSLLQRWWPRIESAFIYA